MVYLTGKLTEAIEVPMKLGHAPMLVEGYARKLRHGFIRVVKAALQPALHVLLRMEQHEKQATVTNELALMYAFLFKHFARTCPRRVLDIGTGTSSLPHLMSHCGAEVMAIDKFDGYWVKRPFNRHFLLVRDDVCDSRLSGAFDMITCTDVIQHVPRHGQALETIARLLRPGGIAIIGCFFNETHYVPDVYRLLGSGVLNPPNGMSCQILSRSEIQSWTKNTGLEVVDEELWNCFTGDYWTFGERIEPPLRSSPAEKHHLICLCLAKR